VAIVVYQSFRVTNVPEWMGRCMASVKEWALKRGYEYRFFGDELFDFVPDWYRNRINNQIHLVADLARLEIAKQFLNNGYEQAIWIDADVLVFAPEQFTLPLDRSFAFCREMYIANDDNKQLVAYKRVNNAITLMSKGNSFLDFYIDASKNIVAQREKLKHTSVGTSFLTAMNQQLPIDHINQVGLFSPLVMRDIALGKGDALSLYMQAFATPIYSANLCFTFNNSEASGVNMSPDLFSRVINNLCDTQGQVVNQFLTSNKKV
jgi:hypothetical protein